MSKICRLIFIIIWSYALGCDGIIPETLRVQDCSPSANEKAVKKDARIIIEFNNPVRKEDVEEKLAVRNNRSALTGDFNWLSSRKVQFIPDNEIETKGLHTITLPRHIRDRDGNIMSKDFISQFYVGEDFELPKVTSSNPYQNPSAITGIAVDQNMEINFSKSMDIASVESNFSLSPSVSGYFIWEEATPGIPNSRMTYRLLDQMDYGKLYTLKVAHKAMDVTGNSLRADFVVNFITGEDFTPPEFLGFFDSLNIDAVPYFSEESLNSEVERTLRIAMRFSEAMDRKSVEDSFSITPSIGGNFSWTDDLNVIFTPHEKLQPEQNYMIKIKKNARDKNGLKLAETHTAEIRTDGKNSKFLRCEKVEGGPWKKSYQDRLNYSEVNFTELDLSLWPVPIAMDETPESENRTQIYCLKFKFSAKMDRYSIYENYEVRTTKTIPVDVDPGEAIVTNISWIDLKTAVIEIDNMSNDLEHKSALYRFTLKGGQGGMKDKNGNYMKRDLKFEMKEL